MFVLIPLFPLLGAAVNGLVGIRFFSRRAVGATAVGAAGLSFAAAVAAFAGLLRSRACPRQDALHLGAGEPRPDGGRESRFSLP